MIVLMTIHQPRTDILNLLDKVLLLSTGRCVWYGSNSSALLHFAELGYPIPENTNPSDFYLDITTLDQRTEELRKETMSRIDKFVTFYEAHMVETVPMVAETAIDKHMKTQWPSIWIVEFKTLLVRNIIDTLRDKATIGATFGQSAFLLVLYNLTSDYYRLHLLPIRK